MPSDYYPATEDEAPESTEDKGAPDEKEPSEAQTTLIPKGLLAGKDFKPGDEVVFKIVHEYDDEVEIEYAPEKGSESKMDGADKAMDGMVTGNTGGMEGE